MAPANPANGPDKRRAGKNGAYDHRFVQRGEKINPQSKENFSSSFLIRGVVILNIASGCTCESIRTTREAASADCAGEDIRVMVRYVGAIGNPPPSPSHKGYQQLSKSMLLLLLLL